MPTVPDPRSVLERVRRDVERNVLRARNGIGLAAEAVLPAAARVGLTPKDVVWRHGRCELWRYRGESYRDTETAPVRPPLLIVFSLISRSYILDLSPGNSLVEHLLAAGFDVFMLDWGVPDERDARNELDDYVDGFIPAGIERVRELTGADDIHLLGYCLGGNLTLLHVAHHPAAPLRTLTVMASPADLHQVGPLGDIFRVGGMEVDAVLDADGNVPAAIVRQGFKSLAPTADVSRYVSLWERLWSDDYVVAYQAMTGWSGDHIPFPGAAARDVVAMLVRDNGMITDRLRVGGDAVHLRDVTVPFLTVLAERDNIVPVESAAPMIDLVGSPDKHELRLPAGHIGLVVGKTAARTTIPQVIEFLRHRSDAV